MRRTATWWAGGAAVVLLMAACGGDGQTASGASDDTSTSEAPEGSTTTTAAAPATLDQAQAEAALLTPEDMGPGWTLLPDGSKVGEADPAATCGAGNLNSRAEGYLSQAKTGLVDPPEQRADPSVSGFLGETIIGFETEEEVQAVIDSSREAFAGCPREVLPDFGTYDDGTTVDFNLDRTLIDSPDGELTVGETWTAVDFGQPTERATTVYIADGTTLIVLSSSEYATADSLPQGLPLPWWPDALAQAQAKVTDALAS